MLTELIRTCVGGAVPFGPPGEPGRSQLRGGPWAHVTRQAKQGQPDADRPQMRLPGARSARTRGRPWRWSPAGCPRWPATAPCLPLAQAERWRRLFSKAAGCSMKPMMRLATPQRGRSSGSRSTTCWMSRAHSRLAALAETSTIPTFLPGPAASDAFRRLPRLGLLYQQETRTRGSPTFGMAAVKAASLWKLNPFRHSSNYAP